MFLVREIPTVNTAHTCCLGRRCNIIQADYIIIKVQYVSVRDVSFVDMGGEEII